MKTMKMTVCVLAFLSFGLFTQAEVTTRPATRNVDIPGGMVYSDNGKPVYYDFASGTRITLAADVDVIPKNGPVTISNDGLVLAWLKADRLFAKRLPDGKPYQAEIIDKLVDEKGRQADEGQLTPVFIPMPAIKTNISNFTLSPGGMFFSFEFTSTENALVVVESGKSNLKTHMVANSQTKETTEEPDERSFPKYGRQPVRFNSVAVLPFKPRNMGQIWGRDFFGNAPMYPASFPIRLAPNAFPDMAKSPKGVSDPVAQSMSTPDIKPGIGITVEDAMEKLSIRRDARYLVWKPSSNIPSNEYPLFAIIYQTGDHKWGPIEIRSLAIAYSGEKPGIWEIPVSLNDCQGLAWKPDGSLTYLSNGSLYSLPVDEISKGIAKSSLTQDAVEDTQLMPRIIPKDNVIQIRPLLVEPNINGYKPYWATDRLFLFCLREKKGGLENIYYLRDDKVERLCPAPKDFSYCIKPLLPDAVASRRGRTPPKFFVGTIPMSWGGDSNNKKIAFGTIKTDGEQAIEVAFPSETNLENIKNPAHYNFRKTDDSEALRLDIGRILIIKIGNRYAAIRPHEVEYKYKTFSEMPESMRTAQLKAIEFLPPSLHEEKRKEMENNPPCFFEWADVEWKYWPASAQISSSENGDKSQNEPLSPTIVKGEATGKIITVGDIQITWQKSHWGTDLSTNTEVIGVKLGIKDANEVSVAPLSDVTTLDNIHNPMEYKYLHMQTPEGYNGPHMTIHLDGLVIFKVGDKYAAIQAIAFHNNSLVYKSKYWPAPATLANLNP